MKRTWKDVDWIELGCRGWEIDETGAWCADPPENLVTRRNPYHTAVGERAHAHLDWSSLDLLLSGPPEWVERAVDDLRAANVLMREVWAVSQSPVGTGTLTNTTLATTGSSSATTWATWQDDWGNTYGPSPIRPKLRRKKRAA